MTTRPVEVRPPEEQAAVEQAVRRYLLTLARRYVPLVAAGLAIILVLVLVPPASETKGNTVATGSGAASDGGAVAGSTQTGTPVAGGTAGGGSATSGGGRRDGRPAPGAADPAAARGGRAGGCDAARSCRGRRGHTQRRAVRA